MPRKYRPAPEKRNPVEFAIAVDAIKGLTRDEVAVRLGCTERALRHYLAGTRPVPRLVAREAVRLSQPTRCVCKAIYEPRFENEICNYCKAKRQ